MNDTIITDVYLFTQSGDFLGVSFTQQGFSGSLYVTKDFTGRYIACKFLGTVYAPKGVITALRYLIDETKPSEMVIKASLRAMFPDAEIE